MDNKQKNAFLKCMDIVDKIVREICIFLMFVMLVLVLLQVVSRYLLPVSLSWTEELARFTMLWLIFLASSHIARKSSYIRVTFIIDRQPDKVKRILSVIVKTIVLITHNQELAEETGRILTMRDGILYTNGERGAREDGTR